MNYNCRSSLAINQSIRRWLRNQSIDPRSLELWGDCKSVVVTNAKVARWGVFLWILFFLCRASWKFVKTWWTMALQLDQSAANSSGSFGLILHQWRFVLVASLYRYFGWPWCLLPHSSSPYNRRLGMQCCPIRMTRPVHRKCALMSIDPILIDSTRSKISRLVMRYL